MTDQLTTDPVATQYGSGIAVITLNRPAARNAATRQMAEQVAAALDEIDDRADVLVAIITGAGGTFCSGMDLKAFAQGERASLPGRGFAGITARPPHKPIIAAVEGYAVAGGFEIVLACDLVVAAENAKFGLPEVKRGLVAVGGGLLRLPTRIPRQRAMQLILTGDLLAAPEAARLGLVDELTPVGGALAAAQLLAAKIVANAPLAVRASKQILTQAPDWPADEAYERQMEVAGPVFASADAREGARAFAEKRAPEWLGQ